MPRVSCSNAFLLISYLRVRAEKTENKSKTNTVRQEIKLSPVWIYILILTMDDRARRFFAMVEEFK